MLLAAELLRSFGDVAALQLLCTGVILLVSLVGLALQMLELFYLGQWLSDSHGVFAVQKQELLLVVGVDALDFLH